MINERIRVPQVRVVDQDNNQIGIMPTREAVDMARDRGLDLVLVAAQAQPPVCRIISYGKWKYEQSKKESKPKGKELKMVRLHPRTGPHDRDILVRNCERFLRDGHKVRVLCQFKGRENAYPELGRAQMDAIADALKEVGTVEGTVNKQGRDMTMMLVPRPGVKPLVKAPKGGKDASDNAVSEEDAKFAAQQAQLAEEAGESADAVADDDTDLEEVESDNIEGDGDVESDDVEANDESEKSADSAA
ncbi:translation initiation factor IF-3 [Abditibacteriota bacterium]|nr:translation initiation factor IF-3 [Abditibacteriota bacterium]